MGEKTIDFAGMVQRLESRGYRGYYCLEYVWVDWDSPGNSHWRKGSQVTLMGPLVTFRVLFPD
jgi:hypothetical protein